MALPLPTYSFANVFGTLSGPGGSIPFGAGTGSAEEEGISIEQNEDANKMRVGAGGDAMHTLILDISGRAAIHVLKTSPLNAALQQMYDYQRTSTAFWGVNVLLVSNPLMNEQYTCQQVAFKRRPPNAWAKDPNQLLWEFDCGQIHAILGV